MEIQKFTNEVEFIEQSVDWLKKKIALCGNEVSVGLCGGNTPKAIYSALNKISFPGINLNFFIIDERVVPIDDANSNYKMISETLGNNNLHYFDTSLEASAMINKFEMELLKFAPNGLDICFFGLGPDGHFASVFPGTEAVVSPANIVRSETLNFAVKERVGMSASFLEKTKHGLILLSGKEKAELIEKIQNTELMGTEFPAVLLNKIADLKIHFWEK